MRLISHGSANKKSCCIAIRMIFIFVCMTVISACSMKSVKKAIPFVSSDSYLKLTLSASSDINPNPAGRASPLNVKTYVLSERTTFDNLRFDAAFEKAKVLLDDELVSQKEYIFQPGESKRYKIKVTEDSKFVVVLAAYREVDAAKWKIVLPVIDETEKKTINLQANALHLVKEKEQDDDEIVEVVENKVDQKVSESIDSELDKVF